jgi:hypothetical protein
MLTLRQGDRKLVKIQHGRATVYVAGSSTGYGVRHFTMTTPNE